MKEAKKTAPPDTRHPTSLFLIRMKLIAKNYTTLFKIKQAFIWQMLSIVVAISCVFIGNYLTEKRESRIERKLGDSILIAMK